MSASKSLPKSSAGFSSVELLVVISLTAMLSVVFMGVVAHYLQVINRNNQLTEMTVSSQNLLRSTVENIRLGDGVRQTNSIADPSNPTGWTTGNTNFVIVIAVPALDLSKAYIIDPVTGSPYMNEIVYYKSDTSLYARKLAHPLATDNTLRTTCPPASATPTCPADTYLAQYVDSMLFILYDQNANETPTPAEAKSIKITLDMQRNSLGRPIDLNTTMRVTLRNRF